MAIINKGEILLEAQPQEAVRGLRGHIWRQIIDKNTLAVYENIHKVISTKMLGGRTVVHIFSMDAPGGGFEAVEPDLEDVYFSTMAGLYGKSSSLRREEAIA